MCLIGRVIPIVAFFAIAISRTQAVTELPVESHGKVKTEFTWHLAFSLNNENILNADKVRAEITEATYYWANLTWFSFKEVSADIPADISFYDSGYFNKNIGELAYSIFPENHSSVAVHIDVHKNWSYLNEADNSAIHLSFVIMHQLGYALGMENSDGFATLITPHYSFKMLWALAAKDEVSVVISERHGDPNICNAKFHAVSFLNGNVVVVFDNIIYIKASGSFFFIRDLWPELPKNLTKVDGFHVDSNGYATIFIGQKVYMFREHKLLDDNPKNLNTVLENSNVKQVDGIYTYKETTYVISGDEYWTMDNWNPSMKTFSGPYKIIQGGMPESTDTALLRVEGVIYIVRNISPVEGTRYRPLNPYTDNSKSGGRNNIKDLVCTGNFMPPACCGV